MSSKSYAYGMHRFGEHDIGRHIDEQLGLVTQVPTGSHKELKLYTPTYTVQL
jgi:hypothetical protein